MTRRKQQKKKKKESTWLRCLVVLVAIGGFGVVVQNFANLQLSASVNDTIIRLAKQQSHRKRQRHQYTPKDHNKQRHQSTLNNHNNKHKILQAPNGISYQVGRSGMLQRVSSWMEKTKRKQQLSKPIADDNTTPSIRGYSPTGGELPRPQNLIVEANQLNNFGEWSQVDKFTCLWGKTSSHNSSRPYLEWQTRAPYVIILGAMKGGTQALTSFLWQHDRFIKKDHGMEIHFFGNFDYHQTAMGIPVHINQEAYALRFQNSHRRFFVESSKSPSGSTTARPDVLALDSTPFYLMGSDRTPQAICCVAPWAKLIALLRNPVDRVESHYRYLHESRWQNQKAMVDWETWIQHDLGLLKETGVVRLDGSPVKLDPEQEAGSQAEFEAWKRYLHHSDNSQQIVGRGLYAIQLEHYFKVLDACDGKSRDDLFVVPSEALRQDTQRVYNDILNFLDVPLVNLTDSRARHETEKGHDQLIPMPPHIRQLLVEFYRPFNHRLYKLLGWSPVWGD